MAFPDQDDSPLRLTSSNVLARTKHVRDAWIRPNTLDQASRNAGKLMRFRGFYDQTQVNEGIWLTSTAWIGISRHQLFNL